MNSKVEQMVSEIDRLWSVVEQRPSSYSEYGSRVMPVLKLYAGLQEFQERKAFQDALEVLLGDTDPARRAFGVDVCLGFFVFRDAIR